MSRRGIAAAALLAGVMGMIEILVLTPHGPAVSPDSVDYVAGALSLAQGRGYVDAATGNPIFLWPPLYSATLAAAHRVTGRTVVEAGRWANAAVFGVLVGVAVIALWDQTRSVFVTTVGTALVLTATPLVGGAAALLSEPLFCLLVLGSCLALRQSVETGDWPWLAGALAGLAGLQRYIGVVLIPGEALLLAWPLARLGWGARLARAAAFLAVAGAPVAAWGWRNLAVVGSLQGPRRPSSLGWLEAATPVVKVLSRALVPERVPLGARAVVLAAVAAGGALVLQRMFRDPAVARRQRLTLACCLAVAMLYLAAMVGAATRTGITAFSDRFLAPVYILLVVVAASLVAWGLERVCWRRVLQAAVLAWCLFPAARYAGVAAAMRRDGTNPLGPNFNDPTWQGSATMAWVRQAGAGARVYSNASDAVWFHTGRAAQGVPGSGSSESAGVCPAGGECYLVWLDRVGWRSYLPRVEQLAARFKLAELRRFPDGTVYTISD